MRLLDSITRESAHAIHLTLPGVLDGRLTLLPKRTQASVSATTETNRGIPFYYLNIFADGSASSCFMTSRLSMIKMSASRFTEAVVPEAWASSALLHVMHSMHNHPVYEGRVG